MLSAPQLEEGNLEKLINRDIDVSSLSLLER